MVKRIKCKYCGKDGIRVEIRYIQCQCEKSRRGLKRDFIRLLGYNPDEYDIVKVR